MATQKVLTQGTSPGVNPELELDFAEDGWVQVETKLTKDRSISADRCVILVGPLNMQSFTLTLGSNAKLRIL